jgi:hypothetical protein
MESEGGFGALILVYPVLMQRVVTTTRARIVEWLTDIVAIKKPVKAAACSSYPESMHTPARKRQSWRGLPLVADQNARARYRASRSHCCQSVRNAPVQPSAAPPAIRAIVTQCRHDEDVSDTDQFFQFPYLNESIVKDYVVCDTAILREAFQLQSISFLLALERG